MPIEFQSGQDYLTPGVHAATVEEVKEVLVTGFPESATRQEIFDQWIALRADIAEVATIDKQWLDGSFVSRKLDPGDLDVATHIDGMEIEALDEDARAKIWTLCGGPNNPIYPMIDSFAVVSYPPDHPAHKWMAGDRDAFRNVFFSRDDRIGPTFVKGFMEVPG
ncbi:MAG TPA: hypothetical protein DEV93_19725 [Chloroflexi bacterium]|nr:hypothetical protein [Chloroflexota bacterium]HCU13402.1 hypothetical protein [Gemmatimonadota bacterium]